MDQTESANETAAIINAMVYDPVLWNLVFAARASDVRDVWVQGRRCVQDGEIAMLHESDALEEIHHATIDLLARRESVAAIPMT